MLVCEKNGANLKIFNFNENKQYSTYVKKGGSRCKWHGIIETQNGKLQRKHLLQ
jgi:hypothetical protein